MADYKRSRADLPAGALITVFGGSGFVGRHVVQALGRRGYRIRVAVRRPNEAIFLKTSGNVGQIEPVQANIRDDASVARAVEGASAVINLVGLLSETGKQSFTSVQIEGAERVARLSKAAGVPVFVQLSSLSADAEGPSEYGRSKAAGEAAVLAHYRGAAILRPSAIFGAEDQLFNRFAALARLLPVLPVIHGATRMQPVYVKDVAEAVARAVETTQADGKIYELGGPEILSVRAIMELTLKQIRRKRLLVPTPAFIALVNASVLQLLPAPLLTVDQVRSLGADTVVSDAANAEGRTLAGLGIVATAPEAVLPSYLARFRKRGQFEPNAEPVPQD
ncbi:MAG: complex I NDUFA9 subunit family protein [Pseudomonadota bacterium]